MKVERHDGNDEDKEVIFDGPPSDGPDGNSFDEDDDMKASNNTGPTPKKSRKGLYIASFVMALAVTGAAVAGYLVAKKEDKDEINSEYSITGEFCQPGSIKDTREPLLELSLAAGRLNRLLTEEEKRVAEKSVLAGFNDASGGCTDPYERWMYGIVMVNQTLVPAHVALEADGNSSLSHTFEEEYNMVLKFETIISCDNCTVNEAFASEYPPSFSATDDEDEEDASGGRNRRHLTGSRVTLSAAAILENIERNFMAKLPDLGQIVEATILTENSGTSTHNMTRMAGGDDDVSAKRLNGQLTFVFHPASILSLTSYILCFSSQQSVLW